MAHVKIQFVAILSLPRDVVQTIMKSLDPLRAKKIFIR